MGDSVASLQVSISFGRFENDNSLSWEKWSSFSQNNYLEEVEKCSTPGSVAQKKAYFEAHYKKIAARKIELLEQENQTQTDPSTSYDLNCQNHTHNSDIEHNPDGFDEPEEDAVRCNKSSNHEDHTNELKEDAFQESNRKVESHEADFVKEETGSKYNIRKEETLKLQEPNISTKINLTRKVVETKKKIPESESCTRKPTQRSTGRVSKPPPIPSISQSPIKKANISSLPKSKTCLERKRVGLHIDARRGQLGKIWNSTSSGSIKESGLNGRNIKAASLAIIGLKTVERAEKGEEFSKKSHAKESEKARLRSKTKAKEDEKEIEVRKRRQSLNFKAKPMPDFYRSPGISTKNPSQKLMQEDAKKKIPK